MPSSCRNTARPSCRPDRRGLVIAAAAAMVACAPDRPPGDVVWAVNVGGPAYTAVDGTAYAAETSVSGGVVGRLAAVQGSQDPTLYQSFREGAVEVAQPVDDGVYDLTFHFAEPQASPAGERRFDAIAEERRVIADLDIVGFRDGRVRSGLTVTVPNVAVADGELNVRFEATAGEATLSALVVRSRTRPAGRWQLVWRDEFDGDAIDSSKWTPDVWPRAKVNDEDQAYTGREKNLRVEDGALIIEAHKEAYDDASYTSGRLHSAGKGDFLYGRFEVRALLPRGQGTWAAIWMLPSDPFRYASSCGPGADWQGSETCDAWPNSGEIDIMEHVGYQMGHVHGTVHNEAYYWAKWEQRKGRILLDDVDDNFHVYALEWSPERIDMFVDDVHYFTYVNEGTGWRAWPYDHAYNLIL